MSRIELTVAQSKALKLIKSAAQYILLYGGSRSGKTRLIVEYIFRMCLHHPGLRVLAARQVYSHAINTLWQQTFKDVARSYHKTYPHQTLFTFKESTHVIEFINGSEIWLAGLDDAERLEKILGGEYGIIYLNECSQIKYNAITMTKTRLAQNIPNFKNKMLMDENPPSPKHWSYKMFIQGKDPVTDEALNKDEYNHMLLNPKDNIENLPSDYIRTLESLPDRDKRRFLYGEFVKVEGAIYNKFDVDKMNIENPPPMEEYSVGIDNTGNNMAAVLIGWSGNNVYILEEYAAYRMSMTEFNTTIVTMWGIKNYTAYPDPAAGALNDLISFCGKADNAVEPGLNFIRELMESGRFFICADKCPGLINEIESYRYDDNGRIVKQDDHLCLAGDTMITTKDGMKKIKDIKIGDYVLTPQGFNKVIDSMMTQKNAHVQQYSSLIGTPDHPLYCKDGTTVPLSDAYIYDIERIQNICKYNTGLANQEKAKLLSGVARDIIEEVRVNTLGSHFQRKLDTYIEIFGNTIMGLFPMGITSTIKMKIQTTIILRTLKWFINQSTTNFMIGVKQLLAQMLCRKQKNGTSQIKADNGIKSMQENIGQNISLKRVLYVGKSLLKKIEDPQQEEHALTNVLVPSETKIDVYNITVEKSHQYYANGILVSNCDALRYGIYSHAIYGGSLLQEINLY